MIKIKTHYIIQFKGIFETGVAILKWTTKTEEVKFNSIQETQSKATKFNFKWIADFWCWTLNKADKGFRTYYVQKIGKTI